MSAVIPDSCKVNLYMKLNLLYLLDLAYDLDLDSKQPFVRPRIPRVHCMSMDAFVGLGTTDMASPGESIPVSFHILSSSFAN